LYLYGEKNYDQTIHVSEKVLTIIENFIDILAIRKSECIIVSSKIPCNPLNPNFDLFEKLLSCLHLDVLTIYFWSKLNYDFQCDCVTARELYEQYIIKSNEERDL
jgi:hypothetical protein